VHRRDFYFTAHNRITESVTAVSATRMASSVITRGSGSLFSEEYLEIYLLNVSNQLGIGAESKLFKKSYGIGRGELSFHQLYVNQY
jgi:hypothetical protein